QPCALPILGHGPPPVPDVEHHGNRLATDTGAAWGGGAVTAVAIEGREAWVLTQAGRRPVARLR
ncbi:MAG: hypothetical protein ACTS11_15810, partial [Roseicyclus sp.]